MINQVTDHLAFEDGTIFFFFGCEVYAVFSKIQIVLIITEHLRRD